jgi:hypothetical protein
MNALMCCTDAESPLPCRVPKIVTETICILNLSRTKRVNKNVNVQLGTVMLGIWHMQVQPRTKDKCMCILVGRLQRSL